MKIPESSVLPDSGILTTERVGFSQGEALAASHLTIRLSHCEIRVGPNPTMLRARIRKNPCRDRQGFRSPNGEGGIRTHGTLRFTGFRNQPDRPLRHLSVFGVYRSNRVPIHIGSRILPA
jgi:hypothetical protein